MEKLFTNKSILVTGGAGFIGSHLVDRLVQTKAKVTVIDNLITGHRENLKAAEKSGLVNFIQADISLPETISALGTAHYDLIFHLASPASPRGYMDNPIETYTVNSFGTHYLTRYALSTGARFLFASTSEVYGDPLEHPQREEYWGNVNPIGIRACYDVSKRFGEMVLTTTARRFDFDFRLVRIFNTYGPRMDPKDGRVIPNLVLQAISNQPLTVHGDGTQTRSFCYVSDLVEYLLRTMVSLETRGIPINIGHPEEYTMLALAKKVIDLTDSTSEITFTDRPEDDPNRRQPDISRAKKLLGYEPQITLDIGLKKTIDFFKTIAPTMSKIRY